MKAIGLTAKGYSLTLAYLGGTVLGWGVYASMPVLMILGAGLIGVPMLYAATGPEKVAAETDVFVAADWDRQHPWATTGWNGRIIALRGAVRRGEIHAWEYEGRLDEILAEPERPEDAIWTLGHDLKARYNAPTKAQKLMILENGLKAKERKIKEEAQNYHEVKKGLAELERQKRMGRGRRRVGPNRPVGYTVWKMGSGWVKNVEETENVVTGSGAVEEYVVGVQEAPAYLDRYADALDDPRKGIGLTKEWR